MEKIKLKMTAPCTADLAQMPDVGNGRFCNQCNKTVHDVSRLSDSALKLFLNTPDKVCMQLHEDQLGRDIMLQSEADLQSIPVYNIAVCILHDLMPGTILGLALQETIVHENRWVAGFLKDEAAQSPLRQAIVSIGLLGIAFTDDSGWFKLFVPHGTSTNATAFKISIKMPDGNYLEVLQQTVQISNDKVYVQESGKIHYHPFIKPTSIEIKEAYTSIKASA